MKKLSFLLILVGIGFLVFGGYQYYQTEAAQKDSLEEAKQILKEKDTTKDISSSEHEATNTPFTPNTGDTVGILEIPSIDGELPIVEGTDPDELEKGVGHFSTSAYPNEGDQIVMSGHRDTVFRRLGDVKIGDKITVKLPHVEKTYEMVDSKIVDADDRTIIKSTGVEELVITTCYPFSYVGNAPDRYILYAKPVD